MKCMNKNEKMKCRKRMKKLMYECLTLEYLQPMVYETRSTSRRSSTPSASTLASEAYQRLFKMVIQNPNHVFQKLGKPSTTPTLGLIHLSSPLRMNEI